MRTTLDLPDAILRRTKIEAVERGCTLRQLVIDALRREMAGAGRPRKRLTNPPVSLATDVQRARDLRRSGLAQQHCQMAAGKGCGLP
jgi:hypothetical protein